MSSEWDKLNQEFISLYQQGHIDRATVVAEKALQVAEQTGDNNHPNVVTSLIYLGSLYSIQKQYAKAESIYMRALASQEKTLGVDHLDVALCLDNLAALYQDQCQTKQAETFYKRSLVIREKMLGTDHPDMATNLNNLAMLYHTQGQTALAEPLYNRALAIREKALGADHPDVATSLNHLGMLYHAQGQPTQAEPLLKRALAIREKLPEVDQSDVATSLNNLAALYHHQGQLAQAEPLLKRSLAILEKKYGADHLIITKSLISLAKFYHSQGQYTEAEPLYKRSLEIREKALGADHPDVAESKNNLAMLKKSMTEPAPDIFDFIETTDTQKHYNLGVMYGMLGKTEQAIAAYRLAIEVDPKNAPAHYNLGSTLLESGLPLEAKNEFEQTIKFNPKMAEGFFMLGSTCGVLGLWEELITATKQGLAIAPDSAQAYYNLGLAYNKLGSFYEALECLNKAVALNGNEKDSSTYFELGKAYRGLGRDRDEHQAYLDAYAADEFNIDAQLHLGAAYLKSKRKYHKDPKAVVYLETKGAINLKDPHYWFYSALGLLASGLKLSPTFAESHLKTLQELSPPLAEELQMYIAMGKNSLKANGLAGKILTGNYSESKPISFEQGLEQDFGKEMEKSGKPRTFRESKFEPKATTVHDTQPVNAQVSGIRRLFRAWSRHYAAIAKGIYYAILIVLSMIMFITIYYNMVKPTKLPKPLPEVQEIQNLSPGVPKPVTNNLLPKPLSGAQANQALPDVTQSPPEQKLPKTGHGVYNFKKTNAMSTLQIVPHAGHANVIVKLRKPGSQKIVCWFLIRKGQSHQTHIPVGQYQITLASGDAWYGEKYLFGSNASYSAINQLITIPKRTHVTVSMTPSAQGTINERSIAADEF